MSVFKRRKRALVGVLALAAAAALIPASAASAVTFPNACKNSVTANQSQIGVTMTATSPASVAPGGTVALTNIQQSANVPGTIFVAGYNLGLLTVGPNTIPTTVVTTIEGTNTVEGTQNTNAVSTSISTTISDPDGSPGTGDETGTDGSFSVTYNDQTWTAGASGTIDFREDTVPIGAGAGVLHTGGVKITAVIQGFLTVRFGCSPGTVTGPDPGVVALDDPAAAFASTTIASAPVNQAPTADAGDDQTVAAGATVNLDGTGSSDPDAGDTLDYSWTQTGGTAVTLTGANTATPSFTAPAGPATLTFELTVCDQEPLCDTDTVVITVGEQPPVNQAPTADAGDDQTVAAGATVNLDGTGSSDPDAGDMLDYSWTQTGGTAVTLTGADTATPSFTAPAGPATLTFELTVCDQEPLCDTDTVVITVGEQPPVNQAPTADAGDDQTVAAGATVNLDGTGSSDPDAGDTLDYSWTQTGGTAVTLTGADTATPSFTAPAGPATLTFELTVCDQEPLCDTDTVVITVGEQPPVNQAPTADAGDDQTVAAGATVNLDGTGSSDPDAGDTLDYSWTQTGGTAVTLTGADTATPSFTAPAGPATLTFELTVCDQEPLCDTDTVVINVSAPEPPDEFKNAAKACKAERALDPEAFREKYGTNRNGANAFGNCVSSHSSKHRAAKRRVRSNWAR